MDGIVTHQNGSLSSSVKMCNTYRKLNAAITIQWFMEQRDYRKLIKQLTGQRITMINLHKTDQLTFNLNSLSNSSLLCRVPQPSPLDYAFATHVYFRRWVYILRKASSRVERFGCDTSWKPSRFAIFLRSALRRLLKCVEINCWDIGSSLL